MMVGVLVLPDVMFGITEASTTRRPWSPKTRSLSSTTAVGLNDWYQEYLRVDCELGTAILNHREIEVFTRQDLPRQKHREGCGQKVPLLIQPKWINTWLIERFAAWRDGGPEMETQVEANVQASALIFGSIHSSRTKSLVKVQEYIASFA